LAFLCLIVMLMPLIQTGRWHFLEKTSLNIRVLMLMFITWY
jgi:hypothetical protein